MGAGMMGLQPLPQGLAGGAPAWGPLWEPPQYRGSGGSKFKVELIQRGQPSHLETQKRRSWFWGRRGQSRSHVPCRPLCPRLWAHLRGVLRGNWLS